MDKKTKIQGAENYESNQDVGMQRKKTTIAGTEAEVAHNAQGITTDLAGFAVSYSNQNTPEYWLLQHGQNIIGSSSECDICLAEATVSSVHAKLVIRRNQNTHELMFTMIDSGSANGTFVNGEDIAYEPYACKHGDIVNIGGYRILLLLFDKEKEQLAMNEAFKGNATDIKSGNYASRDYYSGNKTRIK